ncbi:hypothetical protein IEQ34_015644 [Dendrobium chrysotoxum]|uniref:Alkyl transferase n=1 Tax=Dendrobium chrysotoxum TaxID=161865 RepID=A0AAV7GJG8_DENCH|nr:hypothetical protein IEQ34_015644 [Dendrobium chrysotoxum]
MDSMELYPMLNHIAFIMDGNRRYANKRSLGRGISHKAGSSALISILRYCYEMGVKHITIYAFSIDNFKQKPKEVQPTMDLMKEKIDELLKEQSIVNEYEDQCYLCKRSSGRTGAQAGGGPGFEHQRRQALGSGLGAHGLTAGGWAGCALGAWRTQAAPWALGERGGARSGCALGAGRTRAAPGRPVGLDWSGHLRSFFF